MAAVTVSLEWLLAQDDLGLRLVAGVPAREQLTWAHASDLVDPTPWLTGGELVLTTGIGMPRAFGEQRAYVARLAEAGAAGLGFGVGVRYAAIPAPILAACSERKFPLLEVPLPTPFIAITQAVARRIAQQEVASLQQALTYQRRISRSAIRAGLAGVVSELSKELRCEAVVLDEYAAVMASSVNQVVIGVSGSIPQTAAARGIVPAELAAAAARREQRRVGWFDDLTLSAVPGMCSKDTTARPVRSTVVS
jgi:PucR family transcriptional regulator, purine catabolism regulatory protein